jgi:hypothetical protein
MDFGSMKIKKFRSLSFKLTLWYIVFLGGIIVFAGIFLYQGFKESLLDELDGKLLEIANETYESWYGESPGKMPSGKPPQGSKPSSLSYNW